ncbi:STAS domain-containing protein [Streptomyces fagopyri]|uniref:STAS domain-containing protein n=1 Tax=Streptomyces fagopyri TaxID=2662397 RepID=UPI003401013F
MTPLPHSSFTLTVEAGPGTAHFTLTGELDYDTCDQLLQRTDAFLTAHPELRDLRLDCTELRFCDSMGISTLLMIHRKTTEQNIRLHLDSPPPFLERILNTTGIRQLFSPAQTSEQAERTSSSQRTSLHTPRLGPARTPDSSV